MQVEQNLKNGNKNNQGNFMLHVVNSKHAQATTCTNECIKVGPGYFLEKPHGQSKL